MATRASLARNTAPKEVYEGRVHKWERRWLVHKKGTLKTEVMLELLRWIVTDEQCPELTGPRHPHIKPLKRPVIKQPSKKPGEQLAQEEGQGAGPSGGPSTGVASGALAEQPPAARPAQAEEQLATVPPAAAPVEQAGAAAEVPPPPVQELHPAPVTGPQPQADPDVAAAVGDAPQGAANAVQPLEPNGAAPVGADSRIAGAPTGDPAACSPGAEVQGAMESGTGGSGAAMDDVQVPDEGPLVAASDVEMADTDVAS